MKGKYFPLSSEEVEGYLGSEHMSSLERQAAGCHLFLSFARLSRGKRFCSCDGKGCEEG